MQLKNYFMQHDYFRRIQLQFQIAIYKEICIDFQRSLRTIESSWLALAGEITIGAG